jgi:hypothetical protein
MRDTNKDKKEAIINRDAPHHSDWTKEGSAKGC